MAAFPEPATTGKEERGSRRTWQRCAPKLRARRRRGRCRAARARAAGASGRARRARRAGRLEKGVSDEDDARTADKTNLLRRVRARRALARMNGWRVGRNQAGRVRWARVSSWQGDPFLFSVDRTPPSDAHPSAASHARLPARLPLSHARAPYDGRPLAARPGTALDLQQLTLDLALTFYLSRFPLSTLRIPSCSVRRARPPSQRHLGRPPSELETRPPAAAAGGGPATRPVWTGRGR